MHFHSLVAIPPIEVHEEPERDKEIAELIKKTKQEVAAHPENIYLSIRLTELQSLRNPFARHVESEVEEVMAPYSSEDNEYTEQEFDDSTQWLQERYEKELIDCIRLPEGKIVDLHAYPYYRHYEIVDGKVCQRNAGPMKHIKRTRKCRKMKALLKQPMSRIYRDFHTFATEGCGYTYDEAHNGYGSYYNPNSMWDWYVIGGRWPTTFLVKKDCKNQAPGERCWGDESSEHPAPEGYVWASAARKKDIEWDAMAQWDIRKATEAFHQYEQAFADRTTSDIPYCDITEKGITYFGETVYFKDDTLEKYLERCHLGGKRKYPVTFADLVCDGDWQSSYTFEKEKADDPSHTWENATDQFIDGLSDDDVLVSVDYHM